MENKLVWKVEYHNTDEDWRTKKRTTDEFYSFEEARDFCNIKIGNHQGTVRLVHPNV
jgi:hypothetical protein